MSAQLFVLLSRLTGGARLLALAPTLSSPATKKPVRLIIITRVRAVSKACLEAPLREWHLVILLACVAFDSDVKLGRPLQRLTIQHQCDRVPAEHEYSTGHSIRPNDGLIENWFSTPLSSLVEERSPVDQNLGSVITDTDFGSVSWLSAAFDHRLTGSSIWPNGRIENQFLIELSSLVEGDSSVDNNLVFHGTDAGFGPVNWFGGVFVSPSLGEGLPSAELGGFVAHPENFDPSLLEPSSPAASMRGDASAIASKGEESMSQPAKSAGVWSIEPELKRCQFCGTRVSSQRLR